MEQTSLEYITHTWKTATERVNAFWNVWIDTYLQHLRTTHQKVNFPKATAPVDLKINTIVLVLEPLGNVQNGKWEK